MRTRIWAATHTGLVRRRNEDCYGATGLPAVETDGEVVATEVLGEPCLAVVADGLGGHPCGNVASRLAVDHLLAAQPAQPDELVAAVHLANEAIYEAMSCNTPVVCFRQFNQYVRGDAPAFPVGGGLYAPEFDAESLADTLHEAIGNHGDFHPRRCFLEQSGRKNVFNLCLDSFPYYELALPGYQRGRHVQNLWLDLAIQDNYQLSLLDFIFDRNHLVSRVQGLNNIAKMFDFYFRRFGLQT